MPLLNREQEAFVRKYNYLKFKAAKLRNQLIRLSEVELDG